MKCWVSHLIFRILYWKCKTEWSSGYRMVVSVIRFLLLWLWADWVLWLDTEQNQESKRPFESKFKIQCTFSTECITFGTIVKSKKFISSVQFTSVAQLGPTLYNPMNRSTPGLPDHDQLLEFTQIHIHQVSDAIQPSHPLSSPSPPAPDPSKHQSLSQWVSSSHEAAKVLEFQLQHQSFQWTPRTDLPWSPSWRNPQESSPTPQFKSINSLALSFLHSPTLTSIHDYWKNHSLD